MYIDSMRAKQYKTLGTNKKQLEKSELFQTYNPEMALPAIWNLANSANFLYFRVEEMMIVRHLVDQSEGSIPS